MTQKIVSSAEMTALWRGAYPNISFDNLSGQLIGDEARLQAEAVIKKYNYPLMSRKISARAGYIYKKSLKLIRDNQCDSIISFASGYSMLGLLIAESIDRPLKVYETDLQDIIVDRQDRYRHLKLTKHQKLKLDDIKHRVFDIEALANENLDLMAEFSDCKRPLLIFEGISYFLRSEIRDWLIKAIIKLKNSCLIFEYWPENALEISAIFKNSLKNNLSDNIKETIQSFMLDKNIELLKDHYTDTADVGIGEAEAELSLMAHEEPMLLDQNEFYPIRIFSGIYVSS